MDMLFVALLLSAGKHTHAFHYFPKPVVEALHCSLPVLTLGFTEVFNTHSLKEMF